MIDPFSVRAFFATRYWTVFQKNTQLVPLEGLFLANRVSWLTFSAAVLAVAYRRFSYAER